MSDTFASSDDLRSAAALRHAQSVMFPGEVQLQRGGVLPEVTVTYETWGTLNPDKCNVVLVCHALSGDSHAARHDDADDPGWWDVVIGPGRAIDTDRWFVVCSNVLGGCRGTTGPASINPCTGRPYGPEFPDVTVEDIVDLQARLLDYLGVERLHAVIGGSLGGHQAMCWAVRHPQRVLACAAVATSHRLNAQGVAFNVVGRNAILTDPEFRDGRYDEHGTKPRTGLAIARMLGHITYLSRQSMARKFDHDKLAPREIHTAFEKLFSVGSYLAHQGDRFVERFDANSYLLLSKAMDLFDLGSNDASLEASLARSTCRWLVLSFTSDWLYPPFQSRQVVDALIATGKCVGYCNVRSDAGHDAFLLDEDLDRYGGMIRAFLQTTTPTRTVVPVIADAEAKPPRLDHASMLDFIPVGGSVLDLGCEDGALLARVAKARQCTRLVGVEVDEQLLLHAMSRGFDVIQADLERGLPDFPDQAFDVVVLSQTLQSIVRTESLIDEVLRVGRRVIVSFANFAYRAVREDLYLRGRSPASEKGLLHYAWFNTPNRRFLSIHDWWEFCEARGIVVERYTYLDTERTAQITDDPNLNADLAIFGITRPPH